MAITNATVVKQQNESFEKMLRRFRKQCEKLGVLSDIKKHQHYLKPSEAKKLRRKKAIRVQKKLLEREKVNY